MAFRRPLLALFAAVSLPLAAAALEREGWHILARRLRTPAGEIDLVATPGQGTTVTVVLPPRAG